MSLYPSNWPFTVARIAALLADAGMLKCVLEERTSDGPQQETDPG